MHNSAEENASMLSPVATQAHKSRKQSRPWQWAKRILTSFSVLTLAVLVTGAGYQFVSTKIDEQTYPAPGKLVDVGGYRLHLHCSGSGNQTVVLEAGLGGGVLDWSLVQPEVAKFTRVCAYDHAGAGWSEAGPQPRDSQQIVKELHTLLTNAGLRSPLILVGHSLGGVNVQLYASQYPKEVAGMVLVDSSHENQVFRKELPAPSPATALLIKALAPVGVGRILFSLNSPATLPPAVAQELAATYSHTRHLYSVADESSNFLNSMEQLRNAPMHLANKPLIVLTRGKQPQGSSSPEAAQNSESAWQELQAELATRSSNSQQIIAKNSGHYIQFDQPELVIEAIRQVITAANR